MSRTTTESTHDRQDHAFGIGRLQILFAALLWSSSGFFAKAPWFDGWPEESRGLMLAFWRSFFACLVLVPMIRRPRFEWPLLPMTACFALMVWSFMSAMVHGPAANAIWLQYLSPAWVLIAGVIWFRERVLRGDLVMFCFCLGGVALILFMELRSGVSLYPTAMALLSGITFAGVVLSMRQMKDADPAWLITLNHGATSLLLLPWVWNAEGSVPWTSYLALGFFGVFQMSVPYVIFARGLRTTSSPEASVLALVEPILVPIWVWIAWSQHPSYDPPRWWTWMGAGFILVGLLSRYLPVVLRSLRRSKASSSAVSPLEGGEASREVELADHASSK
ncbi:MAG: DMT family transporter [Planctomycetota bacterium]